MEASQRRLAVLSGQLTGAAAGAASTSAAGAAAAVGGEIELPALSRAPTSGRGAAADYSYGASASTSGGGGGVGASGSGSGSSAMYASAHGAPSSYARVHGEPSRAPAQWRELPAAMGQTLTDVKYYKAIGEGIAKIVINRPEKRNAFRPRTVMEMSWCFADARDDASVGVIVLTGAGADAFCSGGDHGARGRGGYVGADGVPRLNVLDLQVQIRRTPKPVIAMVAGYAVGGGHILHMVCDLTIAADNAVFGQTGPKVGSFDAGYGSTHMAAIVGQKKAREMWFLSRLYGAAEAERMGLVNKVVPLADLEAETLAWCRQILSNSPTALRVLKSAMNAAEDGQAGIQQLAGDATMLFYMSEEGGEGHRAYVEKRRPDWGRFPRLP